MAVAQVESDKLAVTVRKVASIYLLGGVVQLVTVAVDLLAMCSASRGFETNMAQ